MMQNKKDRDMYQVSVLKRAMELKQELTKDGWSNGDIEFILYVALRLQNISLMQILITENLKTIKKKETQLPNNIRNINWDDFLKDKDEE